MQNKQEGSETPRKSLHSNLLHKTGSNVVSCYDNGPVLVISGVHRSLPSVHSPQSSVGLLKWVPKRQAFELHFVLQ